MILFLTNLKIIFYNAFAIHKAIGKQASITKILLTGIFGIFSQTLTQLVAQIQEEESSHDSDENYSHYTKHNKPRKNIFRRHSSEITHITDHNDNDKPSQVYIDTNYKHYNTTIRRTDKGLQLRTIDSPPKKKKPPLPERKYKQEPLKIEPLETITENKLPILPPQLITPPPAYQCLGLHHISHPSLVRLTYNHQHFREVHMNLLSVLVKQHHMKFRNPHLHQQTNKTSYHQ